MEDHVRRQKYIQKGFEFLTFDRMISKRISQYQVAVFKNVLYILHLRNYYAKDSLPSCAVGISVPLTKPLYILQILAMVSISFPLKKHNTNNKQKHH